MSPAVAMSLEPANETKRETKKEIDRGMDGNEPSCPWTLFLHVVLLGLFTLYGLPLFLPRSPVTLIGEVTKPSKMFHEAKQPGHDLATRFQNPPIPRH